MRYCSIKGCGTSEKNGLMIHSIPKGRVHDWTEMIKKHIPGFEATKNSLICENHFTYDDYYIGGVYGKKILKKSAIPCIFIVNAPIKRQLAYDDITSTNKYGLNISNSTISELNNTTIIEPIQLFGNENMLEKNMSTSYACTDPSIDNLNTSISGIQHLESTNTTVVKVKEVNSKHTEPAKKKRKCFVGDFSDPLEIESPNSRLKFWNASKHMYNEHKKKIKILQNENYRLRKKIKTLDNLVNYLKNEKKIISDNCFTVLKVCLA